MASPYLDCLEALNDGMWPLFKHRIVEMIKSPIVRANVLAIGDRLWEFRLQASRAESAEHRLQQEINGLRDDVARLTDLLEPVAASTADTA